MLNELVFLGMKFWEYFRAYEQNKDSASMLHYKTLEYVMKNGEVKISSIADALNMSVPAASTLVSRLYNERLVNRCEDPDNRRATRVTVTEEGKKYFTKQHEEMQAEFNSIFEGVPREDILKYMQVQRSMVANMEKLRSKSKN